ncbi:MAG TPA: TlpA disulfide reductase family protein, partial [Verrucomicrobiae bacterium]|nr:TlpA disulfide reductase family protein [Verrucomicrobiae bacterium]
MAQLTEQRHHLRALRSYEPGRKALLVFFETDCPTCQLTLPYLNALSRDKVQVIALSQDEEGTTKHFVHQMGIRYPVELDRDLTLSRAFNPQSVPTLYLLDENGAITQTLVGFDKAGLNELAQSLGSPPIAPANDGSPAWKPGCASRHLEPATDGHGEPPSAPLLRRVGERASR